MVSLTILPHSFLLFAMPTQITYAGTIEISLPPPAANFKVHKQYKLN